MVFVVDEGGVFEAPLDRVWAFLSSGAAHSAAHGHTEVARRRLDRRSGRYSWVQPFDGRPTRFVMHWTAFPPLGIAYRVLDGPLAGSLFFLYYRDLGGRTAVSIVGEFRSPEVSESALPALVERFFEREFEQDAEAIARLGPRPGPARRRPRRRNRRRSPDRHGTLN